MMATSRLFKLRGSRRKRAWRMIEVRNCCCCAQPEMNLRRRKREAPGRGSSRPKLHHQTYMHTIDPLGIAGRQRDINNRQSLRSPASGAAAITMASLRHTLRLGARAHQPVARTPPTACTLTLAQRRYRSLIDIPRRPAEEKAAEEAEQASEDLEDVNMVCYTRTRPRGANSEHLVRER